MSAGPARGDGAPLARPAAGQPADADLRAAAGDEPLQPALQDVRAVGRHGHLPVRSGLGRARPTASAERDRIRELIGAEAPARALRLRAAARRDRALAADHQPLRRRAAPLPGHPAARPRGQGARPDLHGHHQRRPARAAGARARREPASTRSRSRSTARRRCTTGSAGRRTASSGPPPASRAVARLAEASSAASLPMQIAILPVTELNIDVIAPAIEALRELPLDTINVGLRWFVPEERGRRVRARHAGGPRRRGDVLEGLRRSTGPRSRRRRAGR